jgi:hypothetical protein
MKKRVGSAVRSGSGPVSQRYGSGDPDPDPHQNVTDPQHCLSPLLSPRFPDTAGDIGVLPEISLSC